MCDVGRLLAAGAGRRAVLGEEVGACQSRQQHPRSVAKAFLLVRARVGGRGGQRGAALGTGGRAELAHDLVVRQRVQRPDYAREVVCNDSIWPLLFSIIAVRLHLTVR